MNTLGLAFGLEGPYRRRARFARLKEYTGAALIAAGLFGVYAYGWGWV